jgi:hypothetical protein
MRVAGQRQTADQDTVAPAFRDEDGGMGIAAYGFQIAALLADTPPLAVCCDQPPAGFRADGFG